MADWAEPLRRTRRENAPRAQRRPDNRSGSATADQVLRLQRFAGNSAVIKALAHSPTSVAGGVIQRDPADVLPPPIEVTWGTDPFVITMARSAAGDHLRVSVRYAGDHPVDGISVERKTWSAEISVGSQPFAARIRRRGAAFVEIDLHGDSSRFLRISDRPRLAGFGAPGRSHGLSASLSTGGGMSSSVTIRDPAAASSQLPEESVLDADDPGSRPQSRLVGGRGTEILFDADGDQHKDHLLRIKPEDPERRPADRRVRLSMVPADGGEPVLNTVSQLVDPATTDDLFPIVKEVTDGHAPTRIDLVQPAGSQFLTIEPPTNEAVPSARPSYTFDFAGRRFGALADAAPRRPVGEVTGAGFTGGVLWNDIELGAYDDRFRLTLQPRSGGKAVLGVSPLFRGAALGGEAIEVDYSGVVHFQVLTSGPLSIDLDLTGNGRPDLSVYDQLSTPDEVDGGGPPQRNRNHQLRLVGSAVGIERTFSFRIRDGFPQRAGGSAGRDRSGAANAVAVGAINEQARGASTFAAQIDQYEAAMTAVRKSAADAGTIRPGTYRAWEQLSRAMIRLRPQTADTVQPELQSAAAAAAQDLHTRLTDETRHTQSFSVSQAHVSTSNRYTGEERITTFGTRVTGAGPELRGDIEAGRWDKAFDHYQKLVSGLDKWIVDRLRETKGENDPSLRQAEFLTQSREQLAAIDRHRPTRVLAVFQPDEQFRSEEGFVDHLPLNLYYYRDGGSWYLKNLSNPSRPHHYSVEARDGETVPPASLFAELDDPDRLPAGVVHYDIPGIKGGQVTVTPRLTWRRFLSYLGVGLAVVGLVLSAGTGAVAVAGAWALAGSAVAGGVAAALDIAEKASHGDLDATTAVIDIAQVVAAISGVGALAAGRAARVGFIAAGEGSPLTGQAAATAVAANRIYVVSAGTRVAADVVTVAAMTVQAAEQLDTIENAPGSREEKDRAKALLLAQLAVTGGLTALSIKGELPALGNGRRLVLRTPRGESVPRAFVEGAEATTSVRFSQKDVGGTARGGALTVEQLADEYRRLGFTDEPIRVVELPDGSRVTLDNRRLYAARQAGLSDIPVEYHPAHEPFPAGEAADFVLRDKPIREVGGSLVVGGSAGTIVYPKGAVPATYGEAALFRTANQGTISGGRGRFPLWGHTELPRLRPVRGVGPAGRGGE